ncbi:MAG TPA: beta-1,6-N-acetylglucosaminyltransferase, partial [Chitinophagaceae bacterium]|nr:beta-1,6-N-acetylglucosaminyltransferase [Chitinophagaceae bacterium]
IITYTNPVQTERMIRRMQHPDFDFYIHLDKKVDIDTHRFLADIPQVYFIRDRVDVIWGGYNTIEAELRSVQEIFDTGREYSHIHLMSGQDYPIKPVSYVHDFFVRHRGKEFMAYEHFDKWSSIAYPRIKQYHLTNYRFPGRYQLQWLLNRVLPTRVSPLKMEYYGSSMFWALTPDCLRYILNFMKENDRFRRFIKLTWGADEFLLPTLVMNSAFRKNVINDNLLFLDFPRGTTHPNIIGYRHLPALGSSEKLFTRKMDLEADPAIFDRVDELLVETPLLVAGAPAVA